ncbi:CBS domain-containing protein [Halocatena salina]|uniref:CBS domain-containing protein n=1 Tax=Halocatena salina TaxID=2934340 RepID=A0A8U0A438_9EURY|nr:CBS domain-containing protein [Halocatena salina]UPM43616.1 CBS domain-containing protein [Halocatena salina]
MDVTDAMTPREELVTVSLPGSRDAALEHLRKREFSSVAVVKEENGDEAFRGLISREALIENPDEDQLALLVEEGPTTSSDASLESLAELMIDTGARRVPVVNGGGLNGIVTITDVIGAIAEGAADGERSVSELATRSVNGIYSGSPLRVAEQELRYADTPYAVVIDDEADPVGILTDADLIAVAEIVEGEDDTGGAMAGDDDEWMWEGIKTVGNRYYPTRNVEFPDGTVADYMSDDLITVSRTQTARDAAQLMVRHDIEQIPLMSGGELLGIVQDMDLLHAV